MSTTQDTNNQNRVSTPDTAHTNVPGQSYVRDSTYYCDDSIVILVEGTLFKFPKSILLSHVSGWLHQPPKIKISDIERPEIGTSDSNPLVLSGVTAQQFRWFLFLLLGTPADQEYEALFMPKESGCNYIKDDFLCHLGIYIITRYCGMSRLHNWSYTQLRVIISSTTVFDNTSWDKDTIMQTAACAYEGGSALSYDLRVFLYLALSTLAPNNSFAYQSTPSSNLDICVALYKDPCLPEKYPDIFGYVFTVILSLGHRSSVWTNRLKREDRNILYAAQTHLISLQKESGIDLSWISQPPSQNWGVACESCASHLDAAWGASLASCGSLDSVIPLEDITRLVLLPSYSHKFLNNLLSPRPGPCIGGLCNALMRHKVVEKMQGVFSGMCGKYKYFVENA
ncbi:hypothetical protein BDV93DRAFT_525849 [Ceratobasidium sp. AG-I]|nr:hypothetical protein BDV93DRAFT_525849 [Ceratobasidium sp. AG-I]